MCLKSCVQQLLWNTWWQANVYWKRWKASHSSRYGVNLATNSNNYAHTYLLVILGRQIIGCEKQGDCGQAWLDLFVGALKTMLWHGRKTSPVSASAYELGGNPSGVCAHVHLTLIWWPLLGCWTQELCWCMWPSVHCHAMTPHFPDNPRYLPLGECSSTNVSSTPQHNSLARLDHFGYRKHR